MLSIEVVVCGGVVQECIVLGDVCNTLLPSCI